MSDLIVHQPGRRDKVSPARIRQILRELGEALGARQQRPTAPAPQPRVVKNPDYSLFEADYLDLMSPAEISEYYRDRIAIFDRTAAPRRRPEADGDRPSPRPRRKKRPASSRPRQSDAPRVRARMASRPAGNPEPDRTPG